MATGAVHLERLGPSGFCKSDRSYAVMTTWVARSLTEPTQSTIVIGFGNSLGHMTFRDVEWVFRSRSAANTKEVDPVG